MRTAMQYLVGIILALCVLNWVAPDSYDYDAWTGVYEEELEEAETLSRELDTMSEIVEDRLHTKELLIDDLIHHRRSYEHVIEQFLVMNQSNQGIMVALHEQYPNCNDREMTARNIIDYVGHTSPATSERLTQEFVTLFPHAAPITTSH
jgi:hypothetical protein